MTACLADCCSPTRLKYWHLQKISATSIPLFAIMLFWSGALNIGYDSYWQLGRILLRKPATNQPKKIPNWLKIPSWSEEENSPYPFWLNGTASGNKENLFHHFSEQDLSSFVMLTTLAVGNTDELCRPCVDCGLFTGRFCDGQEFEAAGSPCYAKDRLPGEAWVDNQRTPLCSRCDWRYGKCHYCRGVQSCTPMPVRPQPEARSDGGGDDGGGDDGGGDAEGGDAIASDEECNPSGTGDGDEQSYDSLQKRDALQSVEQLYTSGAKRGKGNLKRICCKVAEEKHVPGGTLYKWWLTKEEVYQKAGVLDAINLMGPKARRVLARKRIIGSAFACGTAGKEIQDCCKEMIKKRIEKRQPVTLPWFTKEVKRKVAHLKLCGWSLVHRGKQRKCGRTWCWRYLIAHGFISPQKTPKRSYSDDAVLLQMKVWLHCVRARILKHPDEVAGAAPATPNIDEMMAALMEVDVVPAKKESLKESKSHQVRKSRKLQPEKCTSRDLGYYKLKQRIHIDQVPMTLEVGARRCFVPVSSADRAVVSGFSGQEKRFATLQVAFHGDINCPQPDLGDHFFKCVRGAGGKFLFFIVPFYSFRSYLRFSVFFHFSPHEIRNPPLVDPIKSLTHVMNPPPTHPAPRK